MGKEVNEDVDDLESTVDSMENEHFVVQHALDEVFDAVMRWCNEYREDIKEEKELKAHREARKKEELKILSYSILFNIIFYSI